MELAKIKWQNKALKLLAKGIYKVMNKIAFLC